MNERKGTGTNTGIINGPAAAQPVDTLQPDNQQDDDLDLDAVRAQLAAYRQRALEQLRGDSTINTSRGIINGNWVSTPEWSP